MASISAIILREEGSRLRAAFQRAKLTRPLTQSDVALACGWKNASTFNRILTGQKALNLESLEKLSEVLAVTPATISPRLAHERGSLDSNRLSRLLHVSHVQSVSRGSWAEPFATTKRILYYCADESSFALTFEVSAAPVGMAGWVAIIEPASSPLPGDRVVMRVGVGKYTLGTVGRVHDSGALDIAVEGKGTVLSTRQKCMLVAGLLPVSRLI